eukprot:SAG31_NODE_34_length_31842_cov_31.677850_30_plen_44_part_00
MAVEIREFVNHLKSAAMCNNVGEIIESGGFAPNRLLNQTDKLL